MLKWLFPVLAEIIVSIFETDGVGIRREWKFDAMVSLTVVAAKSKDFTTAPQHLQCDADSSVCRGIQPGQLSARFRPRSHCSVLLSNRFCCIEATHAHYSVSVQKRREKPPFLCVHTDLPDNKSAAKSIRFCAFTLLRSCETRC